MNAVELLHEAYAAGIDLYLSDGRIGYRGPEPAVEPLLPELRRNKSKLIALLRSWTELVNAIGACCDARGDDEANRFTLLEDCRHEPATKWPWLAWYFRQDAARRKH